MKISNWKKIAAILTTFVVGSGLTSCKNSNEDSKLTNSAKSLYGQLDRPMGLGSLSEGAANKRMIECNKRGYSWIAIIDGGKKPSRCGEKLANIDCQLESIYKMYPDFQESLRKKIYDMPGYQLYNCGEDGDKLSLHFILMRSNKLYYKKLSLPLKQN